MKIVFNAYNLRIGGGETIGLGIIQSLYKLNSPHEFHIFLPDYKPYKIFLNEGRIHIHFVPPFFTRTLIGRLFINFYLITKEKKIRADFIFSMGNYALPLKKKQLLLVHWPYAVYPNSIAWKRMNFLSYVKRKLRAWWFKKNLKFASEITVQTGLMKEQFLKNYEFKGQVDIIPTTYSPVLRASEKSPILGKIRAVKEENKDSFFIICISKYYSHKNLEILVPLAERIKSGREKIKILINLDPYQDIYAKKLLKKIEKNKLQDIVINLGPIPQEDLYEVYKSADAFFLPTLLESFGIIYYEAMVAGLPIFTSDLDFAKDICGETAFYFDPLDAESIFQCLVDNLNKSLELQRKKEASKEKVKSFKSWDEIAKEYLLVIERL